MAGDFDAAKRALANVRVTDQLLDQMGIFDPRLRTLLGLYSYGDYQSPQLQAFARGGTFMAREPIVGVGLVTRAPRFVLGEAGKDERLTIEPTDEDITLGRELRGVRGFQTGGAVDVVANAQAQAAELERQRQGRSYVPTIREMAESQAAAALQSPTGAYTGGGGGYSNEVDAYTQQQRERAEEAYKRAEAARSVRRGQLGAETTAANRQAELSTGLVNLQDLQAAQEAADIEQERQARLGLINLQQQHLGSSLQEYRNIIGAEDDVQNQIDTARAQRQRAAFDPRYGMLGLALPQEIFRPLSGEAPPINVPGVRYAIESAADFLRRQAARASEGRGLEYQQAQADLDAELLDLRNKADQRRLTYEEQQRMAELERIQLAREAALRGLAVEAASVGSGSGSGSSGTRSTLGGLFGR